MNPVNGHENNKDIYEFGAFRLDPAERILERSGERISLAPKAFDTLLMLIQHGGHVLTKDELMKEVWPDTVVEENNLSQHVAQLRRALGEGSDGHTYIETVPRLGYRFVERVVVVSAEESDVKITRRTSAHVVIREQEEQEEELTSTQKAPLQTGLQAPAIRPVSPQGLAASPVSVRAARGNGMTRRLVKPVGLSLIGVVLVGAGLLWIARANSGVPVVLGFAQLTHDGHPKPGSLLTDGEFVYFTESENGKNKLMRVHAAGGDPVEVLEMPPAMTDPDAFSPILHEFLIREPASTDQGEPVFRCLVPGGPCRPVGQVRANVTAWSPNGDRISYAQDAKVFDAKSDGTDQRNLFEAPGTVYSIRYSADGRLLRYLCRKKNAKEYELWETSADGSGGRIVFANVQSEFSNDKGSWTPDAKYLFFAREQDGRKSLWALRARLAFGSESRTLLNTGLMSISAVAPAADGKKVFAIGTLARVEILRLDPRSGAFLPFLLGVSADGLAFSRKGDWVAYTTFPGGTLVRSRLDGTQKLELTNSSQRAELPSWSPDGKQIAYMARAASDPWNGPWRIYVVSNEGGAGKEVVSGTEDQANPTWSPDGSSLVFAGAPWAKGFANDSTAIHIVNMATHNVVTLPGSQGLWSPRWSPNGKFLVAEAIDSRKLLLFNFSTQTWTPLAEARSGLVGYTSWSRDSRFVFFNTYGEETGTILYRVDVEKGVSAQVPIPNVADQPIVFGQWFGLSPDDTPMVLHDISVHEVFAFNLHLP